MQKIKSIGVMIDCSRDGVYTLETLKDYFNIISKMGYTTVQLYTEDVYEIDGEPYFGYLRGRYTKQELKELDGYAKSIGLELIPCIQTLAHLGGITRWQEYKPYTDIDNILLAGDERTYALIDKMFASCAECFTSRRINIGMDEAHMVGLGKYLDKNGYKNRFEILNNHLNRVNEIATRYGFTPMMWPDMFYRLASGGEYYAPDTVISSEIINSVPQNVELVYWDYYSWNENRYANMIKSHKQFKNKISFAGASWSWTGFTPHNRFAIGASESAMKACLSQGIEEAYMTVWGDDGAEASLYSTLPSMLCFAEFSKGNFDIEDISNKFKDMFGVDIETFLAIDKPNVNDNPKCLFSASKYMLYADPFLGIYDKTVDESFSIKFSEIKKELETISKNALYGYIFKTLSSLCSVLEIKYGLGIRTRRTYKSGNKDELKKLISEYIELENRLNIFYKDFRYQWEKERKLNGFEKQDIRIGGLIHRVKNCREILKDFALGIRSEIPPLDEEILTFSKETAEKEMLGPQQWHLSSMIKPFF